MPWVAVAYSAMDVVGLLGVVVTKPAVSTEQYNLRMNRAKSRLSPLIWLKHGENLHLFIEQSTGEKATAFITMYF